MSIKNLTPEHMRCAAGTCHSVHELEDGRWLIVGKRASQEKMVGTVFDRISGDEDGMHYDLRGGVTVNVGLDESAIIISPELLSGVFLNVRQTAEQAEETE